MIFYMKTILLLSALLFSQIAFAEIPAWNDLELNQKYHISKDIKIDEALTLKAGSPLILNDVFAGQLPVILFIFNNPNCTDPEFESEMALYNPEPEDTDHDKTIGIIFSKGCTVDVYVEPQYYYNKSIFAFRK